MIWRDLPPPDVDVDPFILLTDTILSFFETEWKSDISVIRTRGSFESARPKRRPKGHMSDESEFDDESDEVSDEDEEEEEESSDEDESGDGDDDEDDEDDEGDDERDNQKEEQDTAKARAIADDIVAIQRLAREMNKIKTRLMFRYGPKTNTELPPLLMDPPPATEQKAEVPEVPASPRQSSRPPTPRSVSPRPLPPPGHKTDVATDSDDLNPPSQPQPPTEHERAVALPEKLPFEDVLSSSIEAKMKVKPTKGQIETSCRLQMELRPDPNLHLMEYMMQAPPSNEDMDVGGNDTKEDSKIVEPLPDTIAKPSQLSVQVAAKTDVKVGVSSQTNQPKQPKNSGGSAKTLQVPSTPKLPSPRAKSPRHVKSTAAPVAPLQVEGDEMLPDEEGVGGDESMPPTVGAAIDALPSDPTQLKGEVDIADTNEDSNLFDGDEGDESAAPMNDHTVEPIGDQVSSSPAKQLIQETVEKNTTGVSAPTSTAPDAPLALSTSTARRPSSLPPQLTLPPPEASASNSASSTNRPVPEVVASKQGGAEVPPVLPSKQPSARASVGVAPVQETTSINSTPIPAPTETAAPTNPLQTSVPYTYRPEPLRGVFAPTATFAPPMSPLQSGGAATATFAHSEPARMTDTPMRQPSTVANMTSPPLYSAPHRGAIPPMWSPVSTTPPQHQLFPSSQQPQPLHVSTKTPAFTPQSPVTSLWNAPTTASNVPPQANLQQASSQQPASNQSAKSALSPPSHQGTTMVPPTWSPASPQQHLYTQQPPNTVLSPPGPKSPTSVYDSLDRPGGIGKDHMVFHSPPLSPPLPHRYEPQSPPPTTTFAPPPTSTLEYEVAAMHYLLFGPP
ncbi:Aste57867_16804 [Aphanomyces stellatus]|uniref:Aste57867_16804 protein n=1 Tax=Aphanomyces stellatus TaxID=120398 RepID=A0A485L7F9_9STRA|nr:hypothetical protein As57867_016747 [Aphanomyces stellatus]VFT93569.1 Aste57867_16804 [Aphanomyces stellatus]